MDATITVTMTTVAEMRAMEVIFGSKIIHHL